jgi:hypothetical protein
MIIMASKISHSATQVYNLILLWADNSIIIFGGKNTDRHNTVRCACPINGTVLQHCSCALLSHRHNLATDNRQTGYLENLHCICGIAGKHLVTGQQALVTLSPHSQECSSSLES